MINRLARFSAVAIALSTLQTAASATGNPTIGNQTVHRTMFKPVDRSLTQLLDRGWRIVSFSAGLGGYAYLLRRNDKSVTCAASPEQADPHKFQSQCMAMN